MKVLITTSEWPTKDRPHAVPFIVRQVEFLKKYGVDVDVFFFRGSGNPVNYWRAWRACQKKLNSNKYDLIHAQWGQSVVPVISTNLPIVVTYRGDDLEGVVNSDGKYGLKSFVLKILGRAVSFLADQIMVVSSHMIPMIPAKRPITVIPSGLDFEQFPQTSKEEARKRLGLPLDKKIIIFPNNPDEKRKNFKLVNDSIAMLPPEEQDNLLLEVVWKKTHQQVIDYMYASDLMIFASMHEGSPNVVKEALACNLPVVSVDVGDVKERLSEIPGCFVSESYEAKDLSAAVLKALQYDYSNFNSRKYVESIDENVLVKKVLKIYEAAIESRRS